MPSPTHPLQNPKARAYAAFVLRWQRATPAVQRQLASATRYAGSPRQTAYKHLALRYLCGKAYKGSPLYS